MMAATAIPLTRGRFQGRLGRGLPAAAQAAPNRGSPTGAGAALSSLANPENGNGRDPDLSSNRGSGEGEPGYLPPLVWGLWGTVRLSGGRRPAWSGLTLSPSPSLPARLARPAVAWSVRSFARRSFLAARAVLSASESCVSFMGTTRRRASSSRTSTSALVSSRSMVLDTVILLYTFQSY